MKKLAMLSGVAMFSVSILAMSSGAAWADHGDCLNTPGGNVADVPEAAGSNDDFRRGGIQVANEAGAPVSASFAPCGGDPPFPAITEIPNANGGLPGGGPN